MGGYLSNVAQARNYQLLFPAIHSPKPASSAASSINVLPSSAGTAAVAAGAGWTDTMTVEESLAGFGLGWRRLERDGRDPTGW
jgi:hypothetical protein